MYEIELEKAKGQLERVVQTALDGQEVVITQNHKAVLKLVPVPKSTGRQKAGSAKGLVSVSESFDEPLEDFREYMQ